MNQVERPDDTWLREGGNEDVADYIAWAVAETVRLRAAVKANQQLYRLEVSRAAAAQTDLAALRGQLAHGAIVLAHARKQENANGFQRGWHAALSRAGEGDTVADLVALVPQPAAQVEIPVCPAERDLAVLRKRHQRAIAAIIACLEHDLRPSVAQKLRAILDAEPEAS